MPHSANENTDQDNYTLAIVAESLYLINILLVPGLAFIVLGLLYLKHKNHPSAVVRCHLKQTFFASIWAGVMIVIISITIVLIGGFEQAATWVVAVLYFITVHAALVMMGALGLSRAINNQHFHYYLIGPGCVERAA